MYAGSLQVGDLGGRAWRPSAARAHPPHLRPSACVLAAKPGHAPHFHAPSRWRTFPPPTSGRPGRARRPPKRAPKGPRSRCRAAEREGRRGARPASRRFAIYAGLKLARTSMGLTLFVVLASIAAQVRRVWSYWRFFSPFAPCPRGAFWPSCHSCHCHTTPCVTPCAQRRRPPPPRLPAAGDSFFFSARV